MIVGIICSKCKHYTNINYNNIKEVFVCPYCKIIIEGSTCKPLGSCTQYAACSELPPEEKMSENKEMPITSKGFYGKVFIENFIETAGKEPFDNTMATVIDAKLESYIKYAGKLMGLEYRKLHYLPYD